MITISNQYLTVDISPIGGELQSVRDYRGREYLWQGDPAFWGKRAPNLFPYTGRLTEGKFTYRGREYSMPRHGFLMDRKMETERQEQHACTLLTRSDQRTLDCFPFEFAFRISYALDGPSLRCKYRVSNFSDVTMYFGLGAHPAFNLPAQHFSRCSLQFSDAAAPLRIALSEDGYVLPQRTAYPLCDGRLPFGDYPFENSLAFTGMAPSVSLLDHHDREILSMDYPGFDNLVLWRSPSAPFICIEPWCSLPSRKGVVEELTTQPSLICLEEGEFAAEFRIRPNIDHYSGGNNAKQ